MIHLLVLGATAIAAISANAANPAKATYQVKCEDSTKSVQVAFTFNKKDSNSPPTQVSITSSGKTKAIEPKNITRFIRNANDFYVLFKVQTKEGLHELELNTRFNKNPRGPRTSAGVMMNKTQNERVNVTCWF